MQITYLGKGELKYLPWSTYDQETLIGRDKASYRSPRLKKITRNFLDISVIVLKEEKGSLDGCTCELPGLRDGEDCHYLSFPGHLCFFCDALPSVLTLSFAANLLSLVSVLICTSPFCSNYKLRRDTISCSTTNLNPKFLVIIPHNNFLQLVCIFPLFRTIPCSP